MSSPGSLFPLSFEIQSYPGVKLIRDSPTMRARNVQSLHEHTAGEVQNHGVEILGLMKGNELDDKEVAHALQDGEREE